MIIYYRRLRALVLAVSEIKKTHQRTAFRDI